MQRLTPELMLLSSFNISADGVESRELTFNLARRSGVVVNSIHSEIVGFVADLPLAVFDALAQEVDMDPDNIDVLEGAVILPDNLVMDTSRLLRHDATFLSSNAVVGVDGGYGLQTPMESRMDMDFRMLPIEQRPISITNLRHNLRDVVFGGANGLWVGLISLRYIIVELTLEELGVINASRR